MAMGALIAAIAADFVFGVDAVLNAISTMFVIGATLAIIALVIAGVGALGWIIVRDAIGELRFDRHNGITWRWRILGYFGILGILADGLVGIWNAYQQHILFSAAVEQIPFAGLPVLLALASYPVRWIEETWMKKRRAKRISGVIRANAQ
jgi:hypothetical protein